MGSTLAGIWTEAWVTHNIVHQVPNMRAMRNMAKLGKKQKLKKAPIPQDTMHFWERCVIGLKSITNIISQHWLDVSAKKTHYDYLT